MFSIIVPDRWSRLSVLDLGSTTLVMDRGNGKWALIRSTEVPVLRLLASNPEGLPPPVHERCKRLAEELSEAGLGGHPYRAPRDLNTLILKLTNACNYACRYCYDYEPEEQANTIDFGTAKIAMEQALDLAPLSLHVILHGGEPTLIFPLLSKIVRAGEDAARARAKKIVFSGQTNLSRLTTEMVDFSAEHKILWGISLDGPPEVNDRFRVLRTGEGTYHFFARALAEFPEFVRNCGIMTTVTSASETHLLSTARHFRDLGFKSWDWSLFQPIGRGRCAADEVSFSVERVVESWDELFDAVECREFDGFSVGPITKYLANFFDGPGGNMCMRKDCGAGRDLLSISSDGVIEACDCIDPKGPLTGIGQLTPTAVSTVLAQARGGEKASLIRSRNVELGKCSTCIWLAVCGGTCLAHMKSSVHDVWQAQCAIAMNAFVRIATSVAESGRLWEYRLSCEDKKAKAANAN